jgi:hypothetical protein
MQSKTIKLLIFLTFLCCSWFSNAMVAIGNSTETETSAVNEYGGVIAKAGRNVINIDGKSYYISEKTKRYDLNGHLDYHLIFEKGMTVNFTTSKQYNKLNILQIWLMNK